MASGTDLAADLLSVQSPATLAAVRQLRGRLGPTDAHVTDFVLLRFLKARHCNVDDALKLVQKRLRWEVEQGVEQIVAAGGLAEEAEIRRCFLHGYHGVDRQGRPVLIQRFGALDIRALMSCTSPERLIRHFIRESELQLRQKFPACCVRSGRLVHRGVSIIDLQGLSFRAATDPLAVNLAKEIVKMQERRYPEVSAATLIVNAPKIFSLLWRAIKPHLDPSTIAQIQIVGQDRRQVRARLLELVEPDQLPAFLGGSCHCSDVEGGCMHSDRGPWTDGAVLDLLKRVPYYEVVQRFAEGRGEGLESDSCDAAAETQAPRDPAVEALGEAVKQAPDGLDSQSLGASADEGELKLDVARARLKGSGGERRCRRRSLGRRRCFRWPRWRVGHHAGGAPSHRGQDGAGAPQAPPASEAARTPSASEAPTAVPDPGSPEVLAAPEARSPASEGDEVALLTAELSSAERRHTGTEAPTTVADSGSPVALAAPEAQSPASESDEVALLTAELSSVERKHMETLESWAIEAMRWERELKAWRILEAAPLFEAEHRVRLLERQAQDAEARYHRLLSEHEDSAQAMSAMQAKLMVLVKTKRDVSLPEIPRGTYADACLAMKELSDAAAARELQRDSARAEHRGLVADLGRATAAQATLGSGRGGRAGPSSYLLCQPYFAAKRAYEERVLQECAALEALQEQLAAARERSSAEACEVSMTLSDFDLPGAGTPDSSVAADDGDLSDGEVDGEW